MANTDEAITQALKRGRNRRCILIMDDDEDPRGDVLAPAEARSPPKKLANPAPLGLLGFGMTTILLNVHNAGVHQLTTSIVGMGLAFGGTAQFVAGILEYFKGNTFAYVAFCSYGAFWISLVCLWMLDTNQSKPGLSVNATMPVALGAYLLLWGIFTFGMFISALRTNVGLIIVFGTLTLLFVLLSVSSLASSPMTLKIAGIEGIICGASAVYVALAEITNETYGRELLPIFPIDRFRQKSKPSDANSNNV